MKRKSEICFLNVLLCIMVVFIHVSSEYVCAPGAAAKPSQLPVTLLWRFSLIVVPGFIMLSGVKLFLKYRSCEFNAFSFYKSRLSAVLIPYLLWVIAYYIYYCLTKDDMSFSLGKLFFCIYSGEIGGHLYFIIALLQFYLLMPLWVFLFKRVSPSFMLPLMLLVQQLLGQYLPSLVDFFVRGYYFIYADRTFTQYIFWWTAGCFIGLNYESFTEAMRKNTLFTAAVFIMGAGLELLSFFAKYRLSYVFPMEDTIHMLYTLSALLLLFRIGLAVKDSRIINGTFIKYIDHSSFYIYLCHCMILMEINRYMDLSGITDLTCRYLLRIVSVYVLSFGLCTAYTAAKKRFLRK